MKVGLIMCGAHKKTLPDRAKFLYTSDRFQCAYNTALNYCDSIHILSAKYGLLNPDTTISPYNKNLAEESHSNQLKWAEKVFLELTALYPVSTSIHFFAKPLYYEDIRKLLNNPGYKTIIHKI